MTSTTRLLLSFALVAVVSSFGMGTVFGPDRAWAQTADDVKCKKCVDAKDIDKGAVKRKKLKDGAVNLNKLEPKLGERANATQPYYVTMDANLEQKTIFTHGPITLFARCFINEPDGVGGFRDAVRIFATSSESGWVTADNDGPFLAGEEVQLESATVSPTGTISILDQGDGNYVATADGSHVLGYADDGILVVLNTLGHQCIVSGILYILRGTS